MRRRPCTLCAIVPVFYIAFLRHLLIVPDDERRRRSCRRCRRGASVPSLPTYYSVVSRQERFPFPAGLSYCGSSLPRFPRPREADVLRISRIGSTEDPLPSWGKGIITRPITIRRRRRWRDACQGLEMLKRQPCQEAKKSCAQPTSRRGTGDERRTLGLIESDGVELELSLPKSPDQDGNDTFNHRFRSIR